MSVVLMDLGDGVARLRSVAIYFIAFLCIIFKSKGGNSWLWVFQERDNVCD